MYDEALPLIPTKKEALCADIRPVLRETFRDLDIPPCFKQTTSNVEVKTDGEQDTQWKYKFIQESALLNSREVQLKEEYARRLSRSRATNVYRLRAPAVCHEAWQGETGVLQREDLVPSIVEHSGRDTSLWVRNIMHSSSGDLTALQIRGSRMDHPPRISFDDFNTELSVSTGPLPAPPRPATPPSVRPSPPPDHVVCVPPYLEFINFTVGETHTQYLRVVNVSKFELRLSLRPPRRRELDVQLCGERGLTVSAGCALRLRVRFVARDVRCVRDVLLVRAARGGGVAGGAEGEIHVPIVCYMKPPVLEILVPTALSLWAAAYVPEGTPRVRRRGTSCILDLGARLLGETHRSDMMLHCCCEHASFFLITEDAWQSYTIDCITTTGAVISGEFTLYPAWWRGGGGRAGGVRGVACCRAIQPGLLAAAYRILCSTAVCRSLTVVADSLMYRPEHVTLMAHERDYDICSVADQACLYYADVGGGFPGRDLSTPIQLVNHSPIPYTYYWQARAWEGCLCMPPEPGAKPCERCLGDEYERVVCWRDAWADSILVQPSHGVMAPRSQCEVNIGARTALPYGPQFGALVLILENIPIESIPHDYEPIIVASNEIDSEAIPGEKPRRRVVVNVAALQLELRWHVQPPRLLVEPTALRLDHSKRVQSVDLQITTTQLSGTSSLAPAWSVPPRVSPPPATRLTPWMPSYTTVNLTLPLDDEQQDVFTLSSPDGTAASHCTILRSSAPRAPSLHPAFVWLGVNAPGAVVTAKLLLINDTFEDMHWTCEAITYLGLSPRTPASCVQTACGACHQQQCTCGAVRPARGELACGEVQEICYMMRLPETDGLVCSLLQLRHSPQPLAPLTPQPGCSSGRAALVACRVLAPRLVARVMPCAGEGPECKKCTLDMSPHTSSSGCPLLRPSGALVAGRRTCYRLKVTNLTPMPTFLQWENAIDGSDILKVRFIPKLISIGSHATVNIQVILEGVRVCARRVFVRRALIAAAYKPLYLIIDAAVTGLEITCEVPLGSGEKTKSSLYMYRKQSEIFPWEPRPPTASDDIFAEYDRKRAAQNENICKCKYELVYIPPERRPLQPPEDPDDYPPPEIVTEPPLLTRVCKCFDCCKPMLPDQEEPYCLQFNGLPLNTVWSRRITVSNTSCVTARWGATVRRWPATILTTVDGGSWSCPGSAGAMARCVPARGVLGAGQSLAVQVQVRADTWGCYYDQILIQIEHLSPIILDVWVEAVGPPLQFLIKPSLSGDEPPIVWLTAADPERTLRARNTSRADLTVQAYVTVQHHHPQDELPFRLYFRFIDVLPPLKCPCEGHQSSSHSDVCEESLTSSSTFEEMDTDIELYLAPDCGFEDDSDFQAEPRTQTVSAGGDISWQVKLQGEDPPEGRDPAVLLLRLLPQENRGACWCRPSPPPLRARLREPPAPPAPAAALSLSRQRVSVRVCVLELPADNITRIRKHLTIRNTSAAPLQLYLTTSVPWNVVRGARGCGCVVGRRGDAEMLMPARSREQLSLELTLTPDILAPVFKNSLETETSSSAKYEPIKTVTNQLIILDNHDVLKSLPLTVELEFPIICLSPSLLSLGPVCDGDKREAYFTLSHTSRMVTIDVELELSGCVDFKLPSTRLRIVPGEKHNVFVNYTARWLNGSIASATVSARQAESRGVRWCRAQLRVAADPARQRSCTRGTAS